LINWKAEKKQPVPFFLEAESHAEFAGASSHDFEDVLIAEMDGQRAAARL